MTSNDAVTSIDAPLSSVSSARCGPRRRSALAARALGAAALALGMFAGTNARASGFLNPRLADPHGHPALANPYAIYFNPAALGGMRGTHVLVDGTLAFRTIDFVRSPTALSPLGMGSLSDPNYVAANTGAAHAGNFAVIPFVAASSDFGQKYFFAGAGLYAPFGGATKFDQRSEFANNPQARDAIDGPQRWALISGTQQGIYTTAAIGFRLPDERFAFAISGSAVLSNIQHYQARNLAASDEIVNEGRALIDVSGWSGAMAAGVFWEPLPDHKLRIGASYNIRPSFGETRISGTIRQHGPGFDIEKPIDMLFMYPDVARLGIAAMPWGPSVELRLEGELALWSAFKRQCIVTQGAACNLGPDGAEIGSGNEILIALRRDWKNAGAVRVGAGYFLDEKTELYASAGIDTSAVPKATIDVTYPDAFKLMGSIGARREVAQGVAIGASYTYIGQLTVESGRQNAMQLNGASRAPNQDGTYDSKIMFFNLNAAFAF
jgi:long-chain fatty acid transport protein